MSEFILLATGTEAQVCNDIALRQQHGIKKYGTTVADNPLSLRAWLQHAYEEMLDQVVYLRRAIDEIDKVETPLEEGWHQDSDGLWNNPKRRMFGRTSPYGQT